MSLLAAVGYVVIVAVNTAVAAVLSRFFRLRLETGWGAAVYTLVFVPFALILSAVVLSGLFRLGGAAGDREVALVVAIVLPLSLGLAVDFFWMPAPEEIELPERT